MEGQNQTFYLICLHDPCSQEAADYIAQCLSKGQGQGGAELILKQEQIKEGQGGLILHVTASTSRLLELAESMHLKLKDEQGLSRPFKNDGSFPDSGLVGPLTLSNVQQCLLYAMELVHFDKETTFLPGHPHEVKLIQGAPVLASYQNAGLLDMFPLHDEESLGKLYATWSSSPLTRPPIDEIRDYFGENIALYVSFSAFYTRFLIPMALLGAAHYALDRFARLDFIYNNVLFACLNLVAVTIFLEMWKRKSNEHAFHFGTLGKLRHKRPRAAFRGEFGINPVTQEPEVRYPFSKTVKTILTLSVPVTSLCLFLAFAAMLMSFEADKMMSQALTDPETGLLFDDLASTILSFVPSVLYSILVLVFNLKYLHLSHWLTEKENHRTQEQFEKHAVVKLIGFEFVNTFLALFYIAFVLQDVVMLKSQLFTMLIVTQVVNQLQETVIPFVLKKPSSRRMMNRISKKLETGNLKSSLLRLRDLNI